MQVSLTTALDAAIDWHTKLSSMNEAQWEAFVAWLEASAENRFAYDRVAKSDAFLSQLSAVPSFDREEKQPEETHRFRNIAAVTAALAILGSGLLAFALVPSQMAPRIEQTSAGVVKQIAFADGNRLAINGETRLVLDPADPRAVTIDRGEVLFSVKHSQHPFTVEAGGFKILDLGTVFNVKLTDSTLELAVKEGSVLFDPTGARLTVKEGQSISVYLLHNLVVRGNAASVGTWVAGELSFEDSTVAAVAEAMQRRSGIDIRLSPSLSNKPFTGNIRLTGNGAADAIHLARLIGADYHREGAAWIFSPRRDNR